MGSYLNPGSKGFCESLNSEIYIDKTMLIEKTNAVLNTRQKFMCVSRPRRFGKSMAADMLAAYYCREEDSSELFRKQAISRTDSYKKHLNQYDVIKINMQEFIDVTGSIDEMLSMLCRYLIFDLTEHFSGVHFRDEKNLIQVMKDIFAGTKQPFVILIDEWDCLFREYSMTDPGGLAEYFGFTENEVKELCADYQMSFEEARAWYDGYRLVTHTEKGDVYHSIYSPKSVVEAMLRHKFGTYWNQTETYEALKIYIQMDMDGLKEAVVRMLSGESIPVNTGTFSNDMTTFAARDDILTLLVHLGYLTYDSTVGTVTIPNKEVSQEYVNAIGTMDWHEVIKAVETSRRLLESLWAMDSNAVAEGIDRAHKEISILQYNDENSLSCTIHLAFYFAREYYTIIRELPGGKGFADICFVPRTLHMDKPAMIIELKWDQGAIGAIAQIKDRHYVDALKEYRGNLLLVGINYDRKTKKHTCIIEKMQKD